MSDDWDYGYHHPDRWDGLNAACRVIWWALTDPWIDWMNGLHRSVGGRTS